MSEAKEPVPFASVALYTADSTLVSGTTTDEFGSFSLDAKPGKYYIITSFLSFEDAVIPDIQKTEGQSLNLGTITLRENAQMLEEVVIEGERSQMEFKLDKRVFNVGKDLSSTGGNASEVLANVPSVDVDIDGNVSLRGSENVRILIDGKQSGLAGSGNSDALRMLQAGMIEKVEIITNPSSKYEAEGEVGIINIVLKKERQKGFNGSFEVQAGYPENFGGSFSINYRRKWINMFASSGLNYRAAPGSGSSFQQYDGPDTTYSFAQTRAQTRGGLSNVNRFGTDIFINDKNTLTAAMLLKFSDGNNTAKIEYEDLNNAQEVILKTVREEQEDEHTTDIEVSLTHEKTFERKGQKWITDVRYTMNDDTETAELVETNSIAPNDLNYQRSSNVEDESNFLLQSDYTHPIGAKGKFETGTRISLRDIQNKYGVELNNDGFWQPLNDFTDDLRYTENIYAAYGLYANEWKRFSYQGGLRMEYTDIETELKISNQSNPRAYLNFFPSTHLNYNINEYNSLQASYSRRLSRPSFRSLIPFFSYTDPRNFYGGNPDLDPEFTDSYELGYLKMFEKGSFLGSFYYRHTDGIVQRITLTDTTGLIRTFPINLGTQDAYGIEVNFNYDAAKWLRLNGNINAYYASIQGNYRGESYNTTLLTTLARANAMIDLPKDISGQANLRYSAPRNTPQGRTLSITTLDLGFSRDLLKKNGTLILSVKDVFNSRRRRSITETAYLFSESEFQWRARQFLLTFNYRINQQKKRPSAGESFEEDF